MLHTFAVANYRSLRDLKLRLEPLTVVTGANGGLGFETTLALAGHGAHVIMGTRSLERGAAAIDRVRARYPAASLELAEVDTASFTGPSLLAIL